MPRLRCADADGDADADADGDADTGPGPDADGDGTANPASGGDDCDDDNSAIHPGATEVCGDGVDNDCDGGPGDYALVSGSLSEGVEFAGASAEDYAGYAVSGAGDVNADGYDDVLVGVYADDAVGYASGAACLVLGSALPLSASLSTAVQYTGEREGDTAGIAVSSAGDVGADGYVDLLVGASSNGDVGVAAGAAYVVFGSAFPASNSLSSAVEFYGESAYHVAGAAVSGAADVNGDGYDDLLIGAYNNGDAVTGAGATYVVLGSAALTSVSLSSAIQYSGEATANYSGSAVSAGGDADGDGYADVLVGAYGNADAGVNAGAAYLVLGGVTPTSENLGAAVQYTGSAYDRAGSAVAGAGDVNGDGYDDALIGAYASGTDRGAAYLVLGSATPVSSSLATAVEYSGENADDWAGFSVAGPGDVDDDGHDDLLIGALHNSDVGTYGGAAYVVLGSSTPASGTLATALQYSAEYAVDLAGQAVAGGGDVNGDGIADRLVGAFYNDDGATNAGAAYVIFGAGL